MCEKPKHWSGVAERGWVEAQELLDGLYKPFEEMLVGGVSAASVLDVGCGTGATTVRVKGRAVGVDISEPMIAAARERAEREGSPATFILANAQTHEFEPASFDLILSRFGVMFFDDPVRAFTNLRRATKEGGRLHFIAWRSAEENPFMTTAERAAAPLLPNLPPRRPNAPGQFGFADQGRVRSILEASGWGGIEIQPVDVACAMPESELVPYLTRLGPVGNALQGADEQTRAEVMAAVRPAFDSFVQGTEVRFTAACWDVKAATVSF